MWWSVPKVLTRVLIYDVVRVVETTYNREELLDVVWNTWFFIHAFSFTYETSVLIFLSHCMWSFLCHYPTPVPCLPANMMSSTTKVIPFLRYSVEDVDYTIKLRWCLFSFLSKIKMVSSNNAFELLRLTVNDLQKIIASEPLENCYWSMFASTPWWLGMNLKIHLCSGLIYVLVSYL